MNECVVRGVETDMQPWGEGVEHDAMLIGLALRGRGEWHMKGTEIRRNRTEKQRDSLGN
jgi:hypothetical protein